MSSSRLLHLLDNLPWTLERVRAEPAGPVVPAASAVGSGLTPVCPTSRGQTDCDSFRLGLLCVQTATSPRAGACRLRRFRNAVCMNRCALSVLPARLPTVPDGQSAPRSTLPLDTPKIRRANSEALLPRRGKQRRSLTPAAYPCPPGQGCVIPPQPSLPHWRLVSRTAPPPRAIKRAEASFFQKRRKSSSALAPSTPSNSSRSAPRRRERGHRAPVRCISL